MTQKTPTKNEGLLSALTAALRRGADLPNDVATLARGVKALADEIRVIFATINVIATTVNKHTVTINSLLDNQEMIMRKLSTSSVDSSLPDLNKVKSEKPN